ncbi:CHAD domain-containing protein [Arthrobacter liuii]|uniref:CHAD domain-containing protein n=1 Tax=Arthrobacter liuii TaxID=1476996 RepID=A0ABQ2AK83_9MICC|nr:CYTH and CHAD domain-containing protein [Arthrobacter liuii]GGH91518.1 CHAD domain-containing protein [Arthrobacter liuii]
MVNQQTEIEQKYDVDEDAEVPQLDTLPGVTRAGLPHTAVLEAVYFDTERHTLASHRITLRRRTGGTDAGWHLKLPPLEADASGAEPQQRPELHAPLGQPDVVPDSLLARLQAYLRGQEVAPVVRLETSRTTHALYGEDGVHLADLADDLVTAELLHKGEGGGAAGGGQKQHWREWELELVHGEPGLFGPAGKLLAKAGARPAGHASKLARALGNAPGARSATGVSPDGTRSRSESTPALVAGKKAPAAAVVTAYLGRQIGEILAQDPGVRLEEPESVHNMRSALRRIRSVLAAYKKLYVAAPVRQLRDELKWLGQLLGGPRDAEVMLARLRGQLDSLPPGDGVDAVRTEVEHNLGGTYDDGYRLLLAALQSERYFRLLDSLEAFRDNPPVLPKSVAPGRRMAAKAVDKAAKRFRRSRKGAKRARRGTEHEAALHQVRKDAKRLRHVAESAAAVHGKRADKVAKAAHRHQKILGEFHDSVVARDLLAAIGAEHSVPATTGIYAELLKRQEEQMLSTQAGDRKAWKKSRHLLGKGVL